MVDSRTLVAMVPQPVRRLPADLVAVFVFLAVTNVAVFAPVLRETPLRILLGLVLVIFVPGYALVAALFPEAGSPPPGGDDTESTSDDAGESTAGTADESAGSSPIPGVGMSGIDGIERAALSIGLSIAIAPLAGLILNFTPWGIRLVPIMVSLSVFTAVATAVAAIRRWELPADERYRVPYKQWYATVRGELLEPDTRGDAVLNVVLALAFLLAVASVSYAMFVPPDHERFSAVYVLTEDDDGELVADGYTEQFADGGPAEIVLGVDNHEHRTVEYTVVVAEQSIRESGNETVVEEQRELERFEPQLEHDESWHHPHEVDPTLDGDRVRVVWLLYPDEVPDDPTMENAPYASHVWVDGPDE